MKHYEIKNWKENTTPTEDVMKTLVMVVHELRTSGGLAFVYGKVGLERTSVIGLVMFLFDAFKMGQSITISTAVSHFRAYRMNALRDAKNVRVINQCVKLTILKQCHPIFFRYL